MSEQIFKTVRAEVIPADANQRYIYVLDSENPEATLAKELRNFLKTVGYSDIFPNFDNIKVGTIHPFAILIAQEVLGQSQNVNQFPSITIADTQVSEDAEMLADDYSAHAFSQEEIAVLDGYRQGGEVFASDSGWAKIETKVATGEIIGIIRRYHTAHTLDFNLWTENKDITSFLFDMICHFVTQERANIHETQGIDMAQISGRRSGDINLDFGMLLYGANVSVSASMDHTATLFDTGVSSIDEIDTQTLPQYFTLQGVESG
jgi:hypothetical protein